MSFEHLARDARHSARSLARSPAFTLIAVLTLALGIGAVTAIFTVVDAVLFRPLDYAKPERLAYVRHERSATVTPANFLDWRAGMTSFDRMGAAEYWTPTLTGGAGAERLVGLRVSADLVGMYGVAPILGRAFRSEEDHAGSNRVALLRYESWVGRFGSDRSIVGRTLVLDGEPYTVAGVMPPGFRFVPFWAADAELAVPLVLDQRRNHREGSSLRVFGRLAAGVSIERARSELRTVTARLERQFPGSNQGVTAVPLADAVTGSVRPALLVLLGAVGLVLLIACGNTAHLQLIRAAGREREFALRAALGGSRTRLVQQSLVESGLLAVVGGGLGLVIAYAGVRALVALEPAALPRLDTIRIDAGMLGFAAVATMLAAVLFGLAPALGRATSGSYRALREGGRGGVESPGRRRARGVLVGSQFALAVVLLVGAVLVLRSFLGLLAVDPGFDPDRVLTMQVTADRRPGAFFDELVDRTRALPGVVAASTINHLPLHGDNWHFPLYVEGRPSARPGEESSALFRVVRPGYFDAMRIRLSRGRDLAPADRAPTARAVVVNEYLARHHWPGQDPIGRRLSVSPPDAGPVWFTVVGVVADVRQSSWSDAAREEMYFPAIDAGSDARGVLRFLDPGTMTLVVRTARRPTELAGSIRALARSIDRNAPVSDLITMDEAIGEQLDRPRFYLTLLGGFAAVAILLAAIGVYGVLNYSVTRRRREIGIRLALGSDRGGAFGLVVRQGMALAALGGAAGLGGALLLTRFLRTLLFGVGPIDPLSFLAAPALLGVVAFAATAIPGWRAARIDPADALRAES